MVNKGFSLAEVLIATIVMTMMMVTVIGFIHSGSELWRKGYNKIDAQNYKRAAFEMLKSDLMKATSILDPTASTTAQLSSNILTYKMKIFDGSERTCKICINSTLLGNNLIRKFDAAVPPGLEQIYNINISRHVIGFSVTRISTWTIQVFLEIGGEPDESGNMTTISSDTMIFIAPRAG